MKIMNKHKPVSHLRWQTSLKLILQKWRKKSLKRERERVEHVSLAIIQHCAEQYPDTASTLEIGCGPLCISRRLSLKHKTYLDPLIDDFRRMFPGELPEDAEYLSSMAENIAKPTDSYELILCLNTISHCFNPELVMHEIERLLKPGGTLILTIRTHTPIEARMHYWAMQICAFLCRKTRPYYYSLTGIKRTLQRHFNINDEIQQPARAIWLPLLKRERYLFVCTHQDREPLPSNPA